MTENCPRKCLLMNLGVTPYQQVWRQQQELIAARLDNFGLEDVLILVEHPSVYTLGRGSNPDFIKFDPLISGQEIHVVERGGEVTHHCLGQLVGYPILNLNFYQRDLHWYLRRLEEVIIRVLGKFNLKGDRLEGLTGVWLEGHKVAAMGISARRWITMHGFSLNICPNLRGFEQIIPCGIKDKPVGSMAQFIADIDKEKVIEEVIISFAEVFNIDFKVIS